MKVERVKQKPAFKPITITLETPEECSAMWYILNVGESVVTETNSKHDCSKLLYDHSSEFFDKFDTLFGKPIGYKELL